MATASISWKRGSTFAATVDYTPGAGDPETLAGVTIECSVMDNSGTRYPLTITLLEGDVSFTTRYPGDSSGWTAGTAAIDYKLSNGGVIFYSTTARFVIEPQITF